MSPRLKEGRQDGVTLDAAISHDASNIGYHALSNRAIFVAVNQQLVPRPTNQTAASVSSYCKQVSCFVPCGGGGGRAVLSTTGRLCTKGVVFSRWKYMKGSGFHT